MSTQQQIALALRKERLLVRVVQQREQLAQMGELLKKPCAMADKTMSAGRYARAHPWTLGATAGIVALLGRRHLFRLAGSAWGAWRTWRWISGWLQQTGLINRFRNI